MSFTLTWKRNWIIGAKSFFGNPFDGKTLREAIGQTEKITGEEIERIGVDRGYRGKVHHPEGKETLIAGGRVNKEIKRFLRRRSSIEPVIGAYEAGVQAGSKLSWRDRRRQNQSYFISQCV